jgi:hypothetical protein
MVAIVYFSNHLKKAVAENSDAENIIIQEYLLNEIPLYGKNKPKLWIHNTFETNVGTADSLHSLGAPYLLLTIKTIVNQCSQDFNVCLIDDASFSKLLPHWDVDVGLVSGAAQQNLRVLGLLKLVYYYGGIVVPPSFVCCRSLLPWTEFDRPFFAENICHCNVANRTVVPDFVLFGSKKEDPQLLEIIEQVKTANQNPYVVPEFEGTFQKILISNVASNNLTVVNGGLIGIQTKDAKPIQLDLLLGEEFVTWNPQLFGIYIPHREIISRKKYQWFCRLSKHDLLRSELMIAKYVIHGLSGKSVDFTTVMAV